MCLSFTDNRAYKKPYGQMAYLEKIPKDMKVPIETFKVQDSKIIDSKMGKFGAIVLYENEALALFKKKAGELEFDHLLELEPKERNIKIKSIELSKNENKFLVIIYNYQHTYTDTQEIQKHSLIDKLTTLNFIDG